jgi:hypothetical protein
MKKLLIIGSVVGIIIAGSFFARRTLPLFNMLFPPQDLFQPLAKKEVDITRPGTKVQLEFTPKYPGNHELDLEVEKLEEGSLNGKFVMSVVITNEKSEQMHGKIKPYGSYWGADSKGFPLLSFNVPEDISIGKTGHVEVTIATPDVEFARYHGATHLVVRKGSDK